MNDDSDPTCGALRIDALDIPGGGTIGMTHLPGRCGVDGAGRHWRRNLTDDLAAIERWGAGTMATLVESREFAVYGVDHFSTSAHGRRFDWMHLPIADMQVPGAAFARGWDLGGDALMSRLAAGGKVLLHCAGGFGRTGMIAARILVARGVAPVDAIAAVRAARPGTIETAAQERFVLSRAALGSSPQRIGGE